jgi:hypothetical protein
MLNRIGRATWVHNTLRRWYQTMTITADRTTHNGPTTINTGPLVTFIKEIARSNGRAASWTEFAVGGPCDHHYGR